MGKGKETRDEEERGNKRRQRERESVSSPDFKISSSLSTTIIDPFLAIPTSNPPPPTIEMSC
jgi:hypothetical protein